MQTAFENRLAELLGPAVEGLGFELVRVKIIGGNRPTIQVMAEKPDRTMDIDDCARLSRELSAILDVEDPMTEKYVLEVSSPGIDRPLTRKKDYEDFKGYVAKFETKTLINGQKRFKGRIEGLENGKVRIAAEGGETELELDNIDKAKLVLTDELIAAAMKGQHG